MVNDREAGKTAPAGTAGPDDRTVHRLFLKIGASPEMVYDAMQEVRELASHNIVAALEAQSAAVGSKLDLYMAKVDLYKTETGAKLDAHKSELTAELNAQKAETAAANRELAVARSELGTLQKLMVATLSLVALLIALVGALAGLGLYNQFINPSATTAIVAAPSPVVAIPEAVAEETESTLPTREPPPG